MLAAKDHAAALESELRGLKRRLAEAWAQQRPRHEIRAVEDEIRRKWEQLEHLPSVGSGLGPRS